MTPRSPDCRAALLALALSASAPVGLHGQGPPTSLQLVAHEDDDILFMNPDLRSMIAAGQGVVTVYLTAGESRGTEDGTQDRELFAASRQEGEREAYAAMAGVENAPWTWDRSTLAVPGGQLVEVDTLVALPHIQLVFMNLPDGGDPLPEHNLALPFLFDGLVSSIPTLVPTGTPITESYRYTRDDLVSAVVHLFHHFQPTILRSLDPHPVYGGTPPPDAPCPVPTPPDFVSDDNPDHVAAGRLAGEALDLYRASGAGTSVTVLHYKGYQIAQHLGNLGPVEYTWKRGTVDAYKKWDRNLQQFENCYLGFFGATYSRYAESTTWLARQANGRLSAFAVLSAEVVHWAETTPGGDWRGPLRLGGAPVAPYVTVGARPDGRLQIFALRLPRSPAQGPVEVITATQASAAGIAFGDWESLGSADGSYWTGTPAVAANADGRLQVFVKSSAGGVHTKWELGGGGWSGWLDLGQGPDVLDGLAATTSAGGRIELFATTRHGRIAHWYQIAPNDIFTFDATFPTPEVQTLEAVSSPTVTFNEDGRLEVFYREVSSGRVVTAYQTAVDGPWSTNIVNLFGDAGIGPVAAMRHQGSGIIMLFQRNAFGGVSYTAQVGPNTSFSLQWVDLGGLIPAFPSAAADGAGRTVLAAVGTDSRLYVRRQQTASPVADFEQWVAVGSTSAAEGLQRPGDSNQDGILDLSDAVWILGHLFGGNSAELPCEGGSASSPGPGGLSVVDVNGDGGIDISDAVFILGYLFLGDRPPPALGRGCVGVSGCADACSG